MKQDAEDRVPGSKQTFAKIDFVEFVGRREHVANLKLEFLMKSAIFLETLADFSAGFVCLDAASARLLNVLTDKLVSGYFHPLYLPRVLKWASYRSQLDPHDGRYISQRNAGQAYNQDLRNDRAAVYEQFLPMVPAHRRNDICFRLQSTDMHLYLEHWKQAFADEFGSLMSDRRLLAQLISATYHGADHVSDIYDSAMEAFSGLLPLLNLELRAALFADIGAALAQKLICLDFDPIAAYPDFF